MHRLKSLTNIIPRCKRRIKHRIIIFQRQRTCNNQLRIRNLLFGNPLNSNFRENVDNPQFRKPLNIKYEVNRFINTLRFIKLYISTHLAKILIIWLIFIWHEHYENAFKKL